MSNHTPDVSRPEEPATTPQQSTPSPPDRDPLEWLHDASLRWSGSELERHDPLRNIRYITVCCMKFTKEEIHVAYAAAVLMHDLRDRNISQWRTGSWAVSFVLALLISTLGYNILKDQLGDAAAAAVVAAALGAGLLIRELREIGIDEEVRRRNAWNDAINKLLTRRDELGTPQLPK